MKRRDLKKKRGRLKIKRGDLKMKSAENKLDFSSFNHEMLFKRKKYRKCTIGNRSMRPTSFGD